MTTSPNNRISQTVSVFHGRSVPEPEAQLVGCAARRARCKSQLKGYQISGLNSLFPRIVRHWRFRTRFPEGGDSKLAGIHHDDMAIIEESVETRAMAERVVALVCEREPRRTRRRRDAGIRTTRTTPMIPHDQTVRWHRDMRVKAFACAHRTLSNLVIERG